MSGHSIFNRVLLEKEKALGRKEVRDAYILLASSFVVSALGYSTLTYMAALPALSRNPEDSATVISASSGSVAAKSASQKSRLSKSGFSTSASPLNNASGNVSGFASGHISGNPAGSGSASLSGTASGSTSGSSSASTAILSASNSAASALSDPESGVKLLLSIFTRLGSSTQIAMVPEAAGRWAFGPNVWGAKAKLLRDAEDGSTADQIVSQTRSERQSQFNQSLNSNAADPALSIRPQLKKQSSLDEFASNVQSQSTSQQGQFEKQASYSQQGQAGLQLQTAQQAPQSARNLTQASWYRANSQVKIVSESPDIREFTPATKSENGSDNKAKLAARRQVNVVEEPLGRARQDRSNLIESSKDLAAAASNAGAVNGIIRPSEQPGLFKYVREYYKESPKNMPPPLPQSAPAAMQIADDSPVVADARMKEKREERREEKSQERFQDKTQDKRDDAYAGKSLTSSGTGAGSGYGTGAGSGYGASAGGGGNKGFSMTAHLEADKDMGRGFAVSNLRSSERRKKSGAPVQIAFLPPNAVHGITGLSLGASAAETATFLKSRGKVSRVANSGFQILTVRGEHGATLLQAFVRDERLEALRVFNPTFVPPQLGVNLGEELPSMKAKFGEPAFILEEPRSQARAPNIVAKNYVYPISQVSFQLSRPKASSTPQVLSMLLFRFL